MNREASNQFKIYYIHLAWKPVNEALKFVPEQEFDNGPSLGLMDETFVGLEHACYFIHYDKVHYDLDFVWELTRHVDQYVTKPY